MELKFNGISINHRLLNEMIYSNLKAEVSDLDNEMVQFIYENLLNMDKKEFNNQDEIKWQENMNLIKPYLRQMKIDKIL